MMREQLKQRLDTLKKELHNGQQVLSDLDNRRAAVGDTMLRISGAIQVLEELLDTAREGASNEGEKKEAPEHAVV